MRPADSYHESTAAIIKGSCSGINVYGHGKAAAAAEVGLAGYLGDRVHVGVRSLEHLPDVVRAQGLLGVPADTPKCRHC